MIEELSPEQLRRTLDPRELKMETTEKLETIIGQVRAVSALQFGLGIREAGFNIFVSGPPGIGKMTAVKSFLEKEAKTKPTPPDWCYVNNFDDTYQPRMFQLPPGTGRRLYQDLKSLLDHVRREIPKAFESEEYGAKRDEILRHLDKERTELVDILNKKAARSGFVLQATPLGVMIVPVVKDHPLSTTELENLPEAARSEIARRQETLKQELDEAMKKVRDMEKKAQEELKGVDRRITMYVVGGLMDDLVQKYAELPEITNHLKDIQNDILDNFEIFKNPKVEQPNGHPFRKYEVNVLVDNGKQQGAPVVIELNPSYNNLFGRMEKETHFGSLYTDFTLIKGGSLHRANGGYLVLQMEDVLRNLYCWDGLKRTLRSGEIQIEELGERLGFIATKSLRPQAVPLNLKVVLVGPPLLYYLLHAYDPEFPELFKVKAEFDTRMPFSKENIQDFMALVCTFCSKETLKNVDASAMAKILEHAARLAEDQEKLSTHFGTLTNLVREAHYWALQEGSEQVTGAHVKKALEEKVFRSNLIQKRLEEMVEGKKILIETDGEAAGQVNGMSVILLGDYEFGKPVRITASAAPGREGIIDIEREVELGGPIHSKGVYILSGYLSQKFAQKAPLTLAAHLVFEQSYEGVEGDSASSTELFALLSALSGQPIRQGIAVTGSVNQQGEVQAVGGVNQKIEGFFDVCKIKGLTGKQGVIIPHSNMKSLMLREDVVEAVKAKQFHIWTVKTIDEGIEILTGVPAGQRDPDGRFPEGTVNDLVEKRLQNFRQSLKEFGEVPKEKSGQQS